MTGFRRGDVVLVSFVFVPAASERKGNDDNLQTSEVTEGLLVLG